MNFAKIFLDKYNIPSDTILKKKIRGLPGITTVQLVDALVSSDSVKEAATKLGYTENPVKQCIRQVITPIFEYRSRGFSDTGTTRSWKFEILADIGYKQCTICLEIKDLNHFHKNASKPLGISSECAVCRVLKSKEQKQYIKQRTPKWANSLEISEVYMKCPEGMHVDHIVPLRGDLVSGLHVPNNLQYLSPKENIIKNNSFNVD